MGFFVEVVLNAEEQASVLSWEAPAWSEDGDVVVSRSVNIGGMEFNVLPDKSKAVCHCSHGGSLFEEVLGALKGRAFDITV